MIVVVLPAYNEEEAIGPLLVRIKRMIDQRGLQVTVILVDDGSTDGTIDRARLHGDMDIHVIKHHYNQGLGEAIKTGLIAALEIVGNEDIIVTMDADDSHSPALIERMVNRIEEGSDMVIASRYLPESRTIGLSRSRRLMSWGASLLFRTLCPIPGVRDYTCGYRAYRAGILREAFQRWGKKFVEQSGFSCMVDILLKLSQMPLVFSEVPMILRYDRKPGASKIDVRRTIFQTLRLLLRRRLGRYRTYVISNGEHKG